jgi:hypothetical protein
MESEEAEMGRRTPVLVAVVLSALLAAGCGSDGPAGPTPVTIPNYTGIWSGSYVITGCTQNGTIAQVDLCSVATGTAPFSMNITQTSTTPGAAVSGQFTLGTIPFNVSPTTIPGSGALTMTGSTTSSDGLLTIVVTWSLSTPIQGTLTQVWTAVGLSGTVNITGTISSASKTGSFATAPVPQSIPDALRSLRQ